MIPSLILVTVMIHTMNTQSTPSSIPIPAVVTIAGAPAAFGPVPSARQMRWHAMESCMFIHFGVNTFTGAEWGGGKENPTLFNPTKLDCLQWASAAKDAGLRGIIITAKHHDGFCLWPSAVTEHSVKSSPWRDGKGDVLRELSAACRAEGLAFGVYLSPWDRNNPKYGSGEAYNEYFASQLKDVLSNYGEVSEVWFDGACGEGPDGRKQVYDFPKFIDVVRTCQPGACIFSDGGPDVRWVGNESGFGSETNWSRMNAKEFFPGITGRNDDLEHGQRDGTDWLPAEVDVSIRPGWFWRAAEDDRVKSPQTLEKIWFESVGRGCNLLLNIPVDSRGLVAPQELASLKEWGNLQRAMFAVDFAPKAQVSATSTRLAPSTSAFAAANVTDGNPATYWATDDAATSGTLEFLFPSAISPRVIRIEEAIQLGQRVDAFHVELRGSDGVWRKTVQGTTIGVRRILRLEGEGVNGVRVVIDESRACPCISRVSIY